MSTFLLLGARPFPQSEVSPAQVGADIDRSREFISSLRRWQLLDSYGASMAEADEPRTALIMRASNRSAAVRVAAVWSRFSGFEVAVWPLVPRRAA